MKMLLSTDKTNQDQIVSVVFLKHPKM